MTDYNTGDKVPPTEIIDYFEKCLSIPLATALCNLIASEPRQTDDVLATLANVMAFHLDMSNQSTEDALRKVHALHYYTSITLTMARAVGDAVQEGKNAAHH